jgi:hypothetical protein
MVAQKKSTLATSESNPIPASSAIGTQGSLPMPINLWEKHKKIHYAVVALWGVVVLLSLVFVVFLA